MTIDIDNSVSARAVIDRALRVVLAGDGPTVGAVQERVLVRFPAASVHRIPLDEAARPEPGSCVLLTLEQPDLSRLLEWNRWCWMNYCCFLPIWHEFGEVFLGPLVEPGARGCLECAVVRRIDCHVHKQMYRAALNAAGHFGLDPALDASARAIVAGLAADRLAKIEEFEGLQRRFDVFNSKSGDVTRHAFLATNECGCCGIWRDDHSQDGHLHLRASVPSPAGGGWRVRDFGSHLERLKLLYVDKRSGILTNLGIDTENPLCATGAGRFPMGDYGSEQWSAGISHHFSKSQSIAILEALERYAGLSPRRKRTAVRSPYQQVEQDALSPHELTLYSEQQYRLPGFFCSRFAPDIAIGWVWGQSLQSRKPMLVPEQAVYYDTMKYRHDERFLVETSSGCAIGGCMEEAVFAGLLEVVERDAAMRSWFLRQTPRRFDLCSLNQLDAKLSVDRFHALCNYDLLAFDITQEFGIPSIWVMAVGREDGLPATVSATKAHLDPEIAFAGAMGELASSLKFNEKQCHERRPALEQMLADPGLVMDQFDHTELAGLPEAKERFGFLLDAPTDVVSFQDPKWDAWRRLRGDIGAALVATVDAVCAHGFDIVVVEQTSEEEGIIDTRTAKVLVPGLLPISFGGNYARIENSPRLTGVSAAALNLHPHPFP